MKRFAVLQIALLLFYSSAFAQGNWTTGGGGSSLGPSTKTVCSSGCDYTTLSAALDALPRPFGEAPEAAYQSDATIADVVIPDDGHGDEFRATGDSLPASTTRKWNRVDYLIKCDAGAAGTLVVDNCFHDSNIGIACLPVPDILDGATFGSSATVAVSGIGAGYEKVTFSFGADQDASATGAARRGTVIHGDATYNAACAAGVNCCDIAKYSGGTSQRFVSYDYATDEGSCIGAGDPTACCTGAGTGPTCRAFIEGSQVLAGHAYHSLFSETTHPVILLGPGVYAGPGATDVIPPRTVISGFGGSAIINAGTTAWNGMGDYHVEGVTINGPPVETLLNLWRGEQRTYTLNADTSTASTAIVIKHTGAEGSEFFKQTTGTWGYVTYRSVVQLSESGQPTTYYAVTNTASVLGSPGTLTLTADRNIQAVYTAAGATVTKWDIPAETFKKSNLYMKFPTAVNGYGPRRINLHDNEGVFPLFGFIGPIPSKVRVYTQGNAFRNNTAIGTASTSIVVEVNGGVYDGINDSWIFEGNITAAPGGATQTTLFKVTSGNAAIKGPVVKSLLSGSVQGLVLWNSAGGNTRLTNCSIETLGNPWEAKLTSASGAVDLLDCDLGIGGITISAGSATQIGSNQAHGSATGGAGATTAVSVIGCIAASHASCSGDCNITKSVVTAIGTVTATHGGSCDTKTITCECTHGFF